MSGPYRIHIWETNANHLYVHFDHHHYKRLIQFWTMFLLLQHILKDIRLRPWAIMSLKVGVVWVIWDILRGIVSFFVWFLCHCEPSNSIGVPHLQIFLCLSWCVFFVICNDSFESCVSSTQFTCSALLIPVSFILGLSICSLAMHLFIYLYLLLPNKDGCSDDYSQWFSHLHVCRIKTRSIITSRCDVFRKDVLGNALVDGKLHGLERK